MKILLLGGGLQALSCGKSLKELNYHIDAVSDDLQVIKSVFFHKVYQGVNSSSIQIYEILKKEHYDVLIPMVDMNVSFLSKNKKYIEKEFRCKCACVDYDLLEIVEDKHVFMNFCKENRVPHPVTRQLTEDSLEEAIKEVGFPSLIKPDFSIGARGITRVDNQSEVKCKYPEIQHKYGPCTLQELIDNKEFYYNVMLYRNKDGNYLAHTIIKIVRMYPIYAGSSSCCISVENDELLQICKDCLDKLNWVGMADFDVLQNLDTKEFKIIEINPRVPASLKAATISGVNIPEVIVKDLMGLPVPRYSYQPGKIMRYLGIDFMWFLKSPKRFNSNPYWFSFYGKKIYYQDIYRDDTTTWWTWLAEGVKKLGRRNKKLR